MAQPEAPKIIFSMLGVSKKIERKEILRDISLSFYYGAKIGVLGLNGSGKSSLMRILAGIDTEIDGRIHFEPGYSVGFLPNRNRRSRPGPPSAHASRRESST
jgi:sulfate-transporting ATPase